MKLCYTFKTGRIGLLNRFSAKARCSYTQRAAERLWRELKPDLNKVDQLNLSIAWSHFTMGEGAHEFDGLCKEIRERWER
jgi:hypothetical protein